MEKLTIVIPHYNDEENLKTLLSSIEQQEFNCLKEVIILDDGSFNPLQLPHYNFSFRVLKNSRNRGTGYTRNRLFKETTTKFLLSIDSDCRLDENDIIEKIWQKKDFGDIVYPSVDLENGIRIHPRSESETKYIRMSTCFLLNLDQVKNAKIKFRDFFTFFYEDEDFFIQCEKKKLKSHYVDNVIVTHVRNVSGQGERKFMHNEWYALYCGIFLMFALHGSKYFKTRKLITGRELYEIIFHPSWCPGRSSAFFKAIATFFVKWPRVVVLNTIDKIF